MNLNLIHICIGSEEVNAAAHAWTTVSAIVTVAVIGGRALDEAVEDGMDNGFAARVGARLETSVADVGLAIETKLLGKEVAGFVGGVCDGERECYICETEVGDVGYTP